MIEHWKIALFVACCASPALADPVPVRSGEHDGFSRLVLDMPERLEWVSRPRDDGISIGFPDRELQFDVRRVFDRLTRGRLSAIAAPKGRGQLDLTFGCTCEAKVFWHSQSMLVVDIIDRTITVETLPEQPRDLESMRLTGNEVLPSAARALSPAAAMTAAQIHVEDAVETAPVEDTAEAGLSAVRRTLLEEMARAAKQGLLAPSAKRPSAAMQPATLAPSVASLPEGREPRIDDRTTSPHPPVSHMNLRAQAGVDHARGDRFQRDRTEGARTACLPDHLLDVPDWGQDLPFHAQVGALHNRLSQEFDIFDPSVILQLARLYVYFGFGLEARQVAMLGRAPTDEMQILLELAAVMDQPGPPLSTPRLRLDIGCHGVSAVWAALAHDILPKDQLLDHEAILRGFAALPEHLRRYLGPGLARRLLDAGHRETSDMILRGIRYMDPSGMPGKGLAAAELAIAGGDSEQAEVALQEAVDQNAELSAEALLTLIDQRLSEGRAVPYDSAQLAGAYFQEHRGTGFGQRLGRGYLTALAASEAFTEAFSEFDRVAADFSPQMTSETRQDLVRLLTRTAGDFDFLRHVIAGHAGAPRAISPELASDMAKRLMRLGFAEEAQGFLSAAAARAPTPGNRLERAEMASGQDRSHLASIAGETSVRQQLAQASIGETPGDKGSILADSRRLLDQSARVRGVLNNLLAATNIPEAP